MILLLCSPFGSTVLLSVIFLRIFFDTGTHFMESAMHKSIRLNNDNHEEVLKAVILGQMGDFSIEFSGGQEVWSEREVGYVLNGDRTVVVRFKIFGQPRHTVITMSVYLEIVKQLA